MIRIQPRWNSPLASFASRFQISKRDREIGIMPFARKVGVTPSAVYHWISMRYVPRPEHATKIVELSGGTLTLADIYAPRAEMAPPVASAPTHEESPA